MWCPDCRSSSPLAALQPEGLICARCGSEITSERPGTDQSANERCQTTSKLLRATILGPQQLVYRFDKAHPPIGSRSVGSKKVRESIDVQPPLIDVKSVRNNSTELIRQRKLRFLSRLSVLSVALFISGQSGVLWAFSSGTSAVFAAGILVSAIALAVTLYVVSRCFDEQPDANQDRLRRDNLASGNHDAPRPKRKPSTATGSRRRISKVS
jgi:hypothetical protein